MDMPKGKEITLYERERIEVYLRMKKKKSWIARRLGRDYSIIKGRLKETPDKSCPTSPRTPNTTPKGEGRKPIPENWKNAK